MKTRMVLIGASLMVALAACGGSSGGDAEPNAAPGALLHMLGPVRWRRKGDA